MLKDSTVGICVNSVFRDPNVLKQQGTAGAICTVYVILMFFFPLVASPKNKQTKNFNRPVPVFSCSFFVVSPNPHSFPGYWEINS